MSHNHDQDSGPPSFWRTRYGIGLLVIGAVAAYFLLTEHAAHLAGLLPFAFVLVCPLMHLFMHHGHGHGSHDASTEHSREGTTPASGSSLPKAKSSQGDW